MPDVHDIYKYHYFNADGTIGGYSHTPPTWYEAIIAGTVKYFPGGNGVPLNPSEAEGVHWSWWRFTPTNPGGYSIELQPPLVNDDPNKIIISGTLTVFSLIAIQKAYITVYDGDGNELEETRMITGFDNAAREYFEILQRKAAFGVIVPKSETDKAFKFKIKIVATNGYEEEFNNVVSDYFGYYRDVDLTGVPIKVEPKTVKITGTISGITTEDPEKVGVNGVHINLLNGTTFLGRCYVTPESNLQGAYTLYTMPLSEPATLSISAVVDLKMGEANGMMSDTNASSCAWMLPSRTITVHNTDIGGINFNETVPLITVSGIVRLNTPFEIQTIRLEMYNTYWGAHATGFHAAKMWETAIIGPGALQNIDVPWTVKLPKANVRHSGFSLSSETEGNVLNYGVSVNLYVESMDYETLIGGFGRAVGAQDVNDYNIITDITPKPISGTYRLNCNTGLGAKIEHTKIEFWAAPLYSPREFSLIAEQTFDSGAGLQNAPQNWAIEALPNMTKYFAKFVEVTGNRIAYGSGPTEPVSVGIVYDEIEGVYAINDAEIPPVKIWTTDEVVAGKFLHIGGRHRAFLDGNYYNNNMGGQFTNTVYATTLEGRTIAFNAQTGILDLQKLTNLGWKMNGINADGWSVDTARFINGTDVYFFVERDGVFYEPSSNPKATFSTGSGVDPNTNKAFDTMATVDLGTADFGWQRTYIEGTIESIYFNTSNYPGRNRGAMVYAYWDPAYTQLAAVCTIDMADHSYRIQKTLQDAGRTMYLTFVAYIIDDVNLQIKTGWFRPANGQFAVTVTTGERTVVNFAGGIYIEDNNLFPNE